MNNTGKCVLLTGASGFIAAHVLEELLSAGYHVRCTVRSSQKANDILHAHTAQKSQLEFAIVEDIAQPNAFDDAIRAEPPLDYVVHTASPFHFNAQDMQKDLLEPAVQGTLNVLRAVKKYAPTVKRVVITSSFASVIDLEKGMWPGKVYSEDDWNPMNWEQAQKDVLNAYNGSKKFAEKAAWDFIKNESPAFDVVTLNPPMVFGPVINAQSLSSLNTSNAAVWRILSGESKDELPPMTVHLWVDVRDLAKAHVAAMTAPDASNKRILVIADEIYSNQLIADILRAEFPHLKDQIPEGKPGNGLGTKDYYTANNALSKKVLGMKYGKFKPMCIELAKSLLELEKQEKKQ